MRVTVNIPDSTVVMLVEDAALNHPYIAIDDLGGNVWQATSLEKDFETREFGMEDLQNALDILADVEPFHFSNIVTENWDAWTSAALVEIAITGKVVYC